MSPKEWQKAFMSMMELVKAVYYMNQSCEDEVSSVKEGDGGDGGGPFQPSSQ